MYQHIHVTPQSPGKLNPLIPVDVDTVILHALAKKPGERFGSISAFARAFEQALPVNSSSPTIANTLHEPVRSDIQPALISIASPEEQTFPSNTNDGPAVFSSGPVTNSKGTGETTPPNHPNVSTGISTRRRGISRGIAILLVGLALLVVGAGVGFFFFTRSNQQNPYPPYGTLALDDPLNNNSHGYNWLDIGGGSGNCTFTGGAYLVSALDQGSNHYCTASPNFSDSAFQVQMTIVHGDTGGIVFRSDSTKGNGYLFTISQDGKYVLYLFKNSSSSILLGGSSTAINTGLNQSNTIAVVANGSTIDLYVNNQNIDRVTDSTYRQGQIGVSAIDLNNPTEIVFSNAKVWT